MTQLSTAPGADCVTSPAPGADCVTPSSPAASVEFFQQAALRSVEARASSARRRAAAAILEYHGAVGEPPPAEEYEQALKRLAMETSIDALEDAAEQVCGYLGYPDRIAAWLLVDEVLTNSYPAGVAVDTPLGIPFGPRRTSPAHVPAAREKLAADPRTSAEYARRLTVFEAALKARAAEEEQARLAREEKSRVAEQEKIDRWLALSGDEAFDHGSDGRWRLKSVPDWYNHAAPHLSDARVQAVYEQRLQEAARREAAGVAEKAAREARKARLLDAAVLVWGDAALQEGWQQNLIRTADVVQLVWSAVFVDYPGYERVGKHVLGAGALVLGRGEDVTDVERVSAAAYKVLRRWKDDVKARLATPLDVVSFSPAYCASKPGAPDADAYTEAWNEAARLLNDAFLGSPSSRSPSTIQDRYAPPTPGAAVTWELEKTSLSDAYGDRQSIYTALCQVNLWDGALVLEARYRLDGAEVAGGTP